MATALKLMIGCSRKALVYQTPHEGRFIWNGPQDQLKAVRNDSHMSEYPIGLRSSRLHSCETRLYLQAQLIKCPVTAHNETLPTVEIPPGHDQI